MSKADEKRWRRHVRAWKRSGLTCKEFAEREDLKAGTLSWWSWRLRKRDAAKVPDPMAFIEMGAVTVGEPFEVELASRMRLRVPSSFDADALARLLDVLERRG